MCIQEDLHVQVLKMDGSQVSRQICNNYVLVCSIMQLCLTLCGPVDCSLQGSSVHGIFQARIPEQVAISYTKQGGSKLKVQQETLQNISSLYSLIMGPYMFFIFYSSVLSNFFSDVCVFCLSIIKTSSIPTKGYTQPHFRSSLVPNELGKKHFRVLLSCSFGESIIDFNILHQNFITYFL